MTIKEWVYKHRNVTLILLAFFTITQAKAWYDSLVEQRWGWLIFFSITTLVLLANTMKWWENEQ